MYIKVACGIIFDDNNNILIAKNSKHKLPKKARVPVPFGYFEKFSE